VGVTGVSVTKHVSHHHTTSSTTLIGGIQKNEKVGKHRRESDGTA